MYRYTIEVQENGVTFFDSFYADNSREAIEIGYEKYPHADNVEIA